MGDDWSNFDKFLQRAHENYGRRCKLGLCDKPLDADDQRRLSE